MRRDNFELANHRGSGKRGRAQNVVIREIFVKQVQGQYSALPVRTEHYKQHLATVETGRFSSPGVLEQYQLGGDLCVQGL